MTTLPELTGLVTGHPADAGIIAAAVLAAGFGARHLLRGAKAEDVLTLLAAALATAVSMTGMWRFFGSVLHFSGAERVVMFAFLEVAVVACAFRARRNMQDLMTAGAEGIAVWVLSGFSAVFSAMDAQSAAAAAFRLAVPLIAAWLWHRAMSLERRKTTGKTLNWRISTERILVRLGLADPTARDTTDVAAARRIAVLARAAKRLRVLRAAGAWNWRISWARRRLEHALEAAVEHAALAGDKDRHAQLRAQIGALNGAEGLAELDVPAPWEVTQEPPAIPAPVLATLGEVFTELAGRRVPALASLVQEPAPDLTAVLPAEPEPQAVPAPRNQQRPRAAPVRKVSPSAQRVIAAAGEDDQDVLSALGLDEPVLNGASHAN